MTFCDFILFVIICLNSSALTPGSDCEAMARAERPPAGGSVLTSPASGDGGRPGLHLVVLGHVDAGGTR